jgi:hypothetical protein
MSGNYVKTGPFVNASAPGISATFLNNIESVFLRQSGDNENGKYFFEGNAYASGVVAGYWIGFTSRSTPLSVAVDSSLALAGFAAPATTTLDKSGFSVNASATGISNTARFGGNWTVSY